MQKVDGVVDAFVHAFGAVGHKHLALQRLCLMAGTQALQFFDKRAAFFLGQKLGGLHGVHQQLQFCHLKGARGQCPAADVPLAQADYVHAEFLQSAEVCINAFALGRNAAGGQRRNDLRHGQPVGAVCFAGQKVCQNQKLYLLALCACHAFLSSHETGCSAPAPRGTTPPARRYLRCARPARKKGP